MLARLTHIPARPATREELARLHAPAYIDLIKAISERGGGQLDPDTYVSTGSYQAALMAAGGLIEAVGAVLDGRADNAFALVRPPGHHAMPGQSVGHGNGFCLFNNVAIAAQAARLDRGVERVLIVDFDVHHGNGTQAALEHDPAYLYISTHQAYIYPGTGRRNDRGVGNIINVPLLAGSGSTDLRHVWQHEIEPALRDFRPVLILISAGFDAHHMDPLAELNFSEDDYAWLTQQILAVAAECCEGRVVSILEGGYSLPALAASVAVHVKALMEAPRAAQRSLIKNILQRQKARKNAAGS